MFGCMKTPSRLAHCRGMSMPAVLLAVVVSGAVLGGLVTLDHAVRAGTDEPALQSVMEPVTEEIIETPTAAPEAAPSQPSPTGRAGQRAEQKEGVTP